MNAALQSGIYETISGATLLERGDNVTNGSRVVPCSATLTLDLTAPNPALTAVLHNAVLEGGSAYGNAMIGGLQQPFELTVHSLSGTLLADGTYRFSGDYLRDLRPSGSQYLFDWEFSTEIDGSVLWNGHTYWAGGHIWDETISNTA
jgi:hypothetical protein